MERMDTEEQNIMSIDEQEIPPPNIERNDTKEQDITSIDAGLTIPKVDFEKEESTLSLLKLKVLSTGGETISQNQTFENTNKLKILSTGGETIS